MPSAEQSGAFCKAPPFAAEVESVINAPKKQTASKLWMQLPRGARDNFTGRVRANGRAEALPMQFPYDSISKATRSIVLEWVRFSPRIATRPSWTAQTCSSPVVHFRARSCARVRPADARNKRKAWLHAALRRVGGVRENGRIARTGRKRVPSHWIREMNGEGMVV